jgi:hypothetical protein
MGSTDRRFDKPVIEAVLGASHDAGTPQGHKVPVLVRQTLRF